MDVIVLVAIMKLRTEQIMNVIEYIMMENAIAMILHQFCFI